MKIPEFRFEQKSNGRWLAESIAFNAFAYGSTKDEARERLEWIISIAEATQEKSEPSN